MSQDPSGAKVEHFDVVIVGGGPAALSAAIYSGRAELRTLLLERRFLGGQVAQTLAVENYPGFPEGIDGPELISRMEAQARRFGCQFRNEEVVDVTLDRDIKVVKSVQTLYRCSVLILASGAAPRKLQVPGEAELTGRGVSYCGTCDAPLFRGKTVVVVGGGDAALKEGLFISRFASRVIVVHRRRELRAERIYQTEARENPKVAFELDSVVTRIDGTQSVQSVEIRNVKTGESKTVPTDGVFVFIGNVPNTAFLCNLWPDCGGHVETDQHMMTSIPGIFAIGDVRKGSYRQIATAVGEGATAAIAAEHWISELRPGD